MRNIFVSYCHEDADFAQILEGKIREAGFETWRDVNLGAGEEWRSEIDDGIKGALAVVVVMSPGARVSPYVNYEWAFAIGCGVPVLPLLLKLPPADLHPRLGAIQYLDFSNYLSRPWDRLAESLRAIDSAQREFTLHVPRDAPPVVRDAARALDSMNSQERQAAIESLAQMTHPAALQLLADAVHHPVQDVRFGAAFCLGGTLHDARALPALLEALRCQDEGLKLWMISRIGTAAVPALKQALKELPAEQCNNVLSILGYIGGPSALETLVEYLHAPDGSVRNSAAYALGGTKDSAAVPALREATRDPEARVRSQAAWALAECDGSAVVPDLLQMMGDTDGEVRHSATVGLAKICAMQPPPPDLEAVVPSLVDGLVRALADENDQVRAFARKGLQDLHDARAVPGLIAALRGGTIRSKRIFAEVLGELAEAALPAIREVAHDPDETVRFAAAGVLARAGQSQDAPLLVELMRDRSIDVRLEAARRLSFSVTPPQSILDALFERLHDDEEDVCIEAIDALKRIRDPGAVPHLIECLQNDDLASEAANALSFFETREARSALKKWDKSKK